MANATPLAHPSRVDVIRFISTGAFATFWLLILCWAATALGMPLGATHNFIALFTMKPVASIDALWTGALWAFVAGGVIGALVAHCYNLAGRVLGR